MLAMIGADNFIYSHLPHSAVITDFFKYFTLIADEIVLLILSIIAIAFFYFKKKYHSIILLSFSMILSYLTGLALKAVIARPRPDSLIDVSNFSFPSGHAIGSLIFFLVLLYSFKEDIKNKILKYSFISLCIILPLLVGFSRIYLQAHYFSDVIAGFAIAIFWLGFIMKSNFIRYLYRFFIRFK